MQSSLSAQGPQVPPGMQRGPKGEPAQSAFWVHFEQVWKESHQGAKSGHSAVAKQPRQVCVAASQTAWVFPGNLVANAQSLLVAHEPHAPVSELHTFSTVESVQ